MTEQPRFAFGKNWSQFSKRALTSERINSARKSFLQLFDKIPLSGIRFLDVGFGQGLGLVFPTEKGAIVQGIDIDKENLDALSSTCKMCQIPSPSVEVKSILDTDWVNHFANQFSVVDSWGVLHHTGNLDQAFTNCVKLLRAEDAYLVIAIYSRH